MRFNFSPQPLRQSEFAMAHVEAITAGITDVNELRDGFMDGMSRHCDFWTEFLQSAAEENNLGRLEFTAMSNDCQAAYAGLEQWDGKPQEVRPVFAGYALQAAAMSSFVQKLLVDFEERRAEDPSLPDLESGRGQREPTMALDLPSVMPKPSYLHLHTSVAAAHFEPLPPAYPSGGFYVEEDLFIFRNRFASPNEECRASGERMGFNDWSNMQSFIPYLARQNNTFPTV